MWVKGGERILLGIKGVTWGNAKFVFGVSTRHRKKKVFLGNIKFISPS